MASVVRAAGFVSIHASAREATIALDQGLDAVRGFDPRLREGGDQSAQQSRHRHAVSIHASAREATSQLDRRLLDERVSIHASAREATNELWLGGVLTTVSIHASAREATC